MKRLPFFSTICLVVAGSATLLAQRPAPPVPPIPPVAPVAPVPPAPPKPFEFDFHFDDDGIRAAARAEADMAREMARAQADMAREQANMARMMAAGKFPTNSFAFAPQISADRATRNSDRAYQRGQSALDAKRWDEALQAFTEAAGGGSRADGALYWKAYTLAKLGRRDDAVAAIAELTKTYPSSRWLNDAKALELEVKQASGQKVAPGVEDTEELKLLALNGLMQSDPERAVPLVENLLKTSSSPKLRERALFVLAQSDSTRGKQMLEQVARGSAGNPDLQLKAINYIASAGKRTDNKPLLWEIYGSTSDDQVKRVILNSLWAAGDREHVMQIAKTEKSTVLRLSAINMMGASSSQADLWQIYQAESSPEVKQQIINMLAGGGAVDRLVEIAKSEKDAKLRRTAIQSLSGMRSASATDALVAVYTAEKDNEVKKTIVRNLTGQNNAKALVDFARKETDPEMKREIVSQLSHMRSKEATDYLLELLK